MITLRSNGLCKESYWVQNDKIGSIGLESSQLGTQLLKSGHMVLKRVQLGTQYKYQLKWS